MNGTVSISEFMQHLENNDLVIAPRLLVEKARKAYETELLRNKYLNKKALTFKEIADAEIWGEISARAVRNYAFANANEGEILLTDYGKKTRNKIVIEAVKRMAKMRGNII